MLHRSKYSKHIKLLMFCYYLDDNHFLDCDTFYMASVGHRCYHEDNFLMVLFIFK